MSDVNAQIQLKYVEKIRTYLSDYERKTGNAISNINGFTDDFLSEPVEDLPLQEREGL